MPHRHFHRRSLAALAWLALLLLALAPSLGRMLAAQRGGPAGIDPAAAMCTSSGLQWQGASWPGRSPAWPAPPVEQAGFDCEYCVLAAALDLPSALAAGIAPAAAPGASAFPAGNPHPPLAPVHGLGGRGPPSDSEVVLATHPS